MDDFSPAAVARKVEPLREILEARTQLANLMTYMDGKSGAEELLARVMQDASLMESLTSSPKPPDPEISVDATAAGSGDEDEESSETDSGDAPTDEPG